MNKPVAVFTVDPRILLEDVLPAGNTIVGVGLGESGHLYFEIEGIDVPMSFAGEDPPRLRLMLGISPNGARSHWFEPELPVEPCSADVRAKIDRACAAAAVMRPVERPAMTLWQRINAAIQAFRNPDAAGRAI